MSTLFDCVGGTWTPAIGDPSVMGWVTVFAYAMTAALAGLIVHKRLSTLRMFWFLLTLLLCFLTINKQLDLQSALTAIGRCSANQDGWYDQRGLVQLAFIACVSATCLLIGIWTAWSLRRNLQQVWLALLGVVFLLAFVAIRAAGFHHVDRFIGFNVGSIRLNWVLELGGISMIALNALVLLFVTRRSKHRSPRSPS